MDSCDSHQLHVVVFPWLAFGHMIPHLELSKALARRGNRVSFLSTPRNISRLPSLTKDVAALINFVPLSLPRVKGLPDGAEATSDLAAINVQYLKLALDGLKTPFAEFLKRNKTSLSNPVDWVVVDFATHWAPPIAAELGIPCAYFSVFSASSLVFFGPLSEIGFDIGSRQKAEDFTRPPRWIPFPSNLAYSLHGARQIVSGLYGVNASGVSDGLRFRSTIQGCRVIAPRSCMEIEPDCLRLLEDLYSTSPDVVPVGLLPPSDLPRKERTEVVNGERKASSSEKEVIMEWLDKKGRSTVVYVAFGSETTLTVEMMKELALGLELSRLPFLWALKRPMDVPKEVEVLPERFEEKNREKGLVLTSWVPQLDVMAHPSVGGCLTHSGWSSIVEAMQYGHPLVLLPIFADQELNARFVESKGFGVELQRNADDGRFDREAVAAAVRMVMAEEEGEVFRANAREVKEAFSKKIIHERYMDSFVAYLKEHRPPA